MYEDLIRRDYESNKKRPLLDYIPALGSPATSYPQYAGGNSLVANQEVYLQGLEDYKNRFQLLIDKIHSLMDGAFLPRNFYKLDDSRKKDLFIYTQKWEEAMKKIDSLAKEIYDRIYRLSKTIYFDEKGRLRYEENYMYGDNGALSKQIVHDKKDAPRFHGMHLYSLMSLFSSFSSGIMYAMSIHYDVIALFENSSQGIEDLLKNELEMNRELFTKLFERHAEDIKKRQEQTIKQLEQTSKKQLDLKNGQSKLEKLMINRNEIDAEKTGTLSVEQCVFLIGKIKRHYINLRRDDYRSMGFPPETIKMVDKKTIKRYVEFWDQYLKGNIKQGRKPPGKDYSRNMTMEDYSKLINAVELDKYNKWRAKNGIVALHGKRPNQIGNKQGVD